MSTLTLDPEKISSVKNNASAIADDIQKFINKHSSISVERSLLRLYGVDGATKDGTPYVNRIVEIAKKDLAQYGITKLLAAATLKTKRDIQTTAELLATKEIPINVIKELSSAELEVKEREFATIAIEKLRKSKEKKERKKRDLPMPQAPWKYLIVATGNIYEDVLQAQSAVLGGADIVAVIRTTAQSLLDYIPFGATTEGFGGTYATQENFKIMRAALDEIAKKQKRYIQLVNYASGLCMSEITACAAIEDLDMLLNDSMYGILFRDINMQRTFIDQYFSRLICAKAGIIINTGEDNYLTTADAIDNAHTVTASQLINEALAIRAGLPEEQMGLGHAFEINPTIKNGFLYEIAHAQLARQLFPRAPLKYMPPTKYKSTDVFQSHVQDTLFNMASVMTDQVVHLLGMHTEAIHTPLMQDRYNSLGSANYCFNTAASLSSEIEYKKGGIIETRANLVLDKTVSFLREVKLQGLMNAIGEGKFADIKRTQTGGKGLDGVFVKGENYTNPVLKILEAQNE